MPIPTGYAQANLVFAGTGMPNGGEVTIGFDLGSYTEPPDVLAEAVYDQFAASVLTVMHDGIVLTAVRVKYGPDATGPSGEFSGSATGGLAVNGVTPNVAMLVHKVTALGGRAGRGRFYLPGLTEPDVTAAGVIGAPYAAAMQAELDTFYDAMSVGPFTPVVLHGAGSPITTPTPIQAFTLDSRAATQRRRLRS